jgi:hypothetical protein
VGASYGRVAVSHVYPLSRSIADLVRKVAPEFYDRAKPPAGTVLPFEGLPSLDASFAVDVVAVLPDLPRSEQAADQRESSRTPRPAATAGCLFRHSRPTMQIAEPGAA